MKFFYIGCCIGSVLTVIARYLPLKQEARPSCSDDRTSHPAQASFFSLIPLSLFAFVIFLVKKMVILFMD